MISVEELAEALRSDLRAVPASGRGERRTAGLTPFSISSTATRTASSTRSEMEAIVGSLRRLDRDADELIDASEVNPISASLPTAMMQGRPVRDSSVPTVLELTPGESTVRSARLLIKKYDTGSSRGPGRRDSRLSPEEFAIPADAFAAADRDRDGTLNAEELRAYLAQAPRDAILDVAFTPDGSGRVAAAVRAGDGSPQSGMTVRQLCRRRGRARPGPHPARHSRRRRCGRGRGGTEGLPGPLRFCRCQSGWLLEMDELTQDNGQPSVPGRPLQGHRPRRRRKALSARARRIRGDRRRSLHGGV